MKRSYANVAENLSKDPNAPTPTAAPAKALSLWQNASFEFGDFLDIVNPLQHIPIVATIYRNLTDDRIGMAPRVIGGALWGRVTGLVTGVINSLVEWFTGKDIGDHIYAKIWGEPAHANTASLTAMPMSKKDAVIVVDAAQLAAAVAPELVLAPDDLPTREIIQVNQNSDATSAAIPQKEWQESLPRHFHHLPYRVNGNVGEPQDGIGKLNIDA